MSVISNSLLLVRRIGELHRRRESLAAKQDQLRQSLPDWALEPLRLVGMSADEIRGLVSDLSQAEEEAGLDTVESDIDRIDSDLESLEGQLLTTNSSSFAGIESVLSLAVKRYRSITVTDPSDVFYDHGEARALALLERALEDMGSLMREDAREVG